MTTNDRIKSVLSDLGRATLRGVRRCPKCGTFNGTRGLSCKNCNCLFKEKRKFNTEACKLITGNSTSIFSVRVHDKGPDYRGFVQLPLIQKSLTQETGRLALSETALCFVDSCQRLFDASILKCHENDETLISPMCQHVEAAVKCSNEASILEIKNNIVNLLDVNSDVKQEIYQFASQIAAPLVQRVSKNVMAVKCFVSPKHPLGYLHLSFFIPKMKEKLEDKFYCSCVDLKVENKRNIYKSHYKNNLPIKINKKCVHYYTCLCAFASDEKLAEEFSSYLIMESCFKIPIINNSESLTTPADNNALISMFNNNLINTNDVCDIEVEVLNNTPLLNTSNLTISEVIDANIQVQNLEISPNGEVTVIKEIKDDDNNINLSDLSEHICLSDIGYLSNNHLEIIPIKKMKTENTNLTPIKVSKKNKRLQMQPSSVFNESKKFKKVSIQKQETVTPEEKRTYQSFTQWLASITERINQTMHYQFNGKPEPLIFHAPQTFFDCLRERISCGGTKKRLPNKTYAFVRKEAVPLGTFTKYTWHITNILHLKQIFETSLVPLEVTKSFVENRDGTFDLYKPKGDENDEIRKDGLIPIKPLEHKTYLKVGNTTRNQIEPTPFIIEWIPDILPISKIGELRLRFEYGHQKGNTTKFVQIPKNHKIS